MRRLAVAAACVAAASLGLGASFVLAEMSAKPASHDVTFCDAPPGQDGGKIKQKVQTPNDVLNGHANQHDFDIIPAFTATLANGTQTVYEGKNLETSYGGYKGSTVLADGCQILGATEALPQTVLEPPTVEAVTATNVTTVVQTVISVPQQTVTLPGASTTVIVTGGTTTVTTPGSTVALPATTFTQPGTTVTTPARTVTQSGATIREPAQTVTAPGAAQTVTAIGTTTVTVAAPATRYVRGGVLAARIRVAIQRIRERIRLARRAIRVVLRQRRRAEIIIVIRSKNCPPGTRIFNGRCAEIAHGRG
jgi:hypothetical protein